MQDATAQAAQQDRSIDPVKGTWIAIPLVLGLLVASLIPFAAIWGLSPLERAWKQLDSWVLLGIMAVGLVVHEAIHGITWMLAGRLRRADIAYGINWRALAPFAHAKRPLRARAYRIGAFMPCLLLGIVPLVAGTASGSATATLFGAAFVVFAAGDLMVLFLLRREDPAARVQDHPTRWGCVVVDA